MAIHEYTEFTYWGGTKDGTDHWKCLDCGEILLSGLARHTLAHGKTEVRVRGSQATVG